MRTVHSVINMSPPNLLKEVVMVDDFSDKGIKLILTERICKINTVNKQNKIPIQSRNFYFPSIYISYTLQHMFMRAMKILFFSLQNI